jgi:hypothetical protein
MNTIPIFARGVSVVPGAIVCPNLPALQLTFSLYTESWSENMSDKMTHGQSRLVDGNPIPSPNFEYYGCALIPSGTQMLFVTESGVGPIVRSKLPNGKTIRGLTLESMIYGPELDERRQIEKNLKIRDEEFAESRYQEIMSPEYERHTKALNAENERHTAMMRQINPLYSDMFFGMTLDQVTPQQRKSADCISENCQAEEDRHISILEAEYRQYDSAQRAARKQAKQP